MSRMKSSDLAGLWAVAWRLFVYWPLALGVFLILLGHLAGLAMLPLLGAVWLWFGPWPDGLAAVAGWLLLLWSWRRFRLREYLQEAPSVL